MLLPCVSVLWGAASHSCSLLCSTHASPTLPPSPSPCCCTQSWLAAWCWALTSPWTRLLRQTPVRNEMCGRGSALAIQSLCWWRLHRCVVALALLQWCCSFDPQPWAALCSALWHPSGKANWNLGDAQPPCWNQLYEQQKKQTWTPARKLQGSLTILTEWVLRVWLCLSVAKLQIWTTKWELKSLFSIFAHDTFHPLSFQ